MLDRENAKKIIDGLQAVLKTYDAEHLDFKIGHVSFSPSEIRIIVSGKLKGDDGQKAAQELWNKCCGAVGLKPEDFGATFIASGHQFKIKGINLRRSRYPIDAERYGDGKGYKFGAESIQRLLHAPKPNQSPAAEEPVHG